MNNSTPFQVPVETQRNRATRRFALSRRRQRKGQALILAVLIMLMVAVLSAGFLVVVSGNLNQTARVTDKTRAVESARSGLKFVNDQLTYSQLGENWRPGFLDVKIGDNVPGTTTPITTQQQADNINNARLAAGESRVPPANDPARSIYYSSVDQANNWAGTFAKFPDPLAPRSDAPQYLARVQRIPTELDAGDPDATDATKQGMLKITVIGLSNDDPAAFSKVVAYKQPLPFGRSMREVNNWDFKNNVVPAGRIDPADGSTATQLNLSGVQGQFPMAPFTIVVGNGTGTSSVRSAVVTAVSAPNKLTLATALSPAPSTNGPERVELAAQLGSAFPIGSSNGPSATDFDNDSNTPPTPTDLHVSQPALTGLPQSGSLWVNGSASFSGDLALPDLIPQDGSKPYYSSIRTSGLIVPTAGTVSVSLPKGDGSGNQEGIGGAATPNTLSGPSQQNSSLLTGVTDDAAQPVIADGLNRILNAGGSNRQIAPIAPPDIASGLGAARYRRLASARGNNNPSNQLGIYINNPSDRERVYDVTDPNNPKLRDMTQAEMVRMWLSRKADGTNDTDVPTMTDTTTLSFRRSVAPDAVTATSASLEQQHLRGWVGSDEFRARGASVELITELQDPSQSAGPGNPLVAKVAVTLDSRSDNTPGVTTNAFGPVAAKVWKDETTGAPQPGLYRKVFAWPTDGVIFAEGNVRVRGQLTNVDAPNSLTIVSQNNIYIEGSLGAGTKKVLLMARKNVVTNPTSLVSRVEAATTFTSRTGMVATVADAGQFQPGDWIHFNASPTTLNASVDPATGLTVTTGEITSANLARVVSVNVDPNTKTLILLTLDRSVPAATAGSLVRAVADPLDPSVTADVNAKTVRTTWEKISNFSQVIQRRLPPPNLDANNTPIPFRLAFLHSAEQRLAGTAPAPALSIAFSNPPGPTNAQLTSKTPPPPTAGDPAPVVVAKAQKILSILQNASTTPDTFDLTTSTTLTAFVADANNPSSHLPNGTPPPTWTYNFSTPTTAGADYGGINPIALTGIGNRLSLEATPTVVTNPSQNLLGTGANDKNMTVATSITPFFGGSTTPTPLITDLWGKTPVPVPAFGFAVDPTANEDVLTGDASFYVPDATGVNPQLFALDSRSIPVTAAGNQTFALAFSRDSSGTLTGFADPIANPAASNKLPFYRLGALKLENLVPDPNPGANGEVKFSGIKPVSMNINAFVYAQTGSWFVIPAPSFDDAAKNNQDAERDGQMDGSDALNAYRFARYNYQINFTGAIAENQTAIVNSIPGTLVVGAVQQWSNSWANVETNTTTPTAQRPGVVYTFDPSYADPANAIHGDPGFVMPQSDQLTYVE